MPLPESGRLSRRTFAGIPTLEWWVGLGSTFKQPGRSAMRRRVFFIGLFPIAGAILSGCEGITHPVLRPPANITFDVDSVMTQGASATVSAIVRINPGFGGNTRA